MTVSVLWLFLAVLWVGLQCVIVLFPCHNHLINRNKSVFVTPVSLERVVLLFFTIIFAGYFVR